MKREIIDSYLNLLGYENAPQFLKRYLAVPTLVRLKKVDYFCGMSYCSSDVYHFKEFVSRYDHSLATALWVWKFSHDPKMTISALFHDISTPCFSHVIDYMNKDYSTMESTEIYTEKILKSDPDILRLLEEDGFSFSDISNFKKYSLVDLPRPMMCADRMDGIIFPGLLWTETLKICEVKKIIDDCEVVLNEDGKPEYGFRTLEVALKVRGISDDIDEFCHSREDCFLMELLAKIVARSIDLGLIEYDDLFFKDDFELLQELENSGDKVIKTDLKKFKTIRKDEIPQIELPMIKRRNIRPFVNKKRLNV